LIKLQIHAKDDLLEMFGETTKYPESQESEQFTVMMSVEEEQREVKVVNKSSKATITRTVKKSRRKTRNIDLNVIGVVN